VIGRGSSRIAASPRQRRTPAYTLLLKPVPEGLALDAVDAAGCATQPIQHMQRCARLPCRVADHVVGDFSKSHQRGQSLINNSGHEVGDFNSL
jgi:hypothetical protein